MAYNDDEKRKKMLAESAQREVAAFQSRQKAQEKSKLQLKLGTLKSDLDKIGRELANKASKLRVEESVEANDKRQIISAHAGSQKHKEEVDRLEKEISKLEHGLRGDLVKKLKEDLARIQAEITEKENELRRKKVEEIASEREEDREEARINSLKAELSRLNNGVDSSEATLTAKEKQTASRVHTLESEIQALKTKGEGIQREIDHLSQQISLIR